MDKPAARIAQFAIITHRAQYKQTASNADAGINSKNGRGSQAR
jgi:hypothetical protein